MNELEGNVPTKRKEENEEAEMGAASQVADSPYMNDDMEIDLPETPISLQVSQMSQMSQMSEASQTSHASQTSQTSHASQTSQIPQVLPFLPMMPFLPVPPMTPQQQQTLMQNMRSYEM